MIQSRRAELGFPITSVPPMWGGKPAANLRREVAERMISGEPLAIRMQASNGDNLVNFGAHYMALRKFAREVGLPANGIALSSNEHDFKLEQAIRQVLINSGALDSLGFLNLSPHYLSDKYLGAAIALGVEVNPVDLERVPPPVKTDKGVFKDFDLGRVQEEGRQLRRKLKEQGDPLVVISQSGGGVGKRLSDEQITVLARTVKDKLPGSYLTVFTDRDLLAENLRQELNRRNMGVDYARVKSPLRLDRFSDSELGQAITALGSDPFAKVADTVVRGTEFSEFAVAYFAMDRWYGTDSFGSWSAASILATRGFRNGYLREGEDAFTVLHTLGDPQVWRIPKARVLESKALVRASAERTICRESGLLSLEDYFYYGTGLSPTHPDFKDMNILSGVYERDFDLLRSAIKEEDIAPQTTHAAMSYAVI